VRKNVQLGGLGWPIGLGRRDSTTASLSGANSDLPSPFINLNGLIAAFQKKQFTKNEMVALSGTYTSLHHSASIGIYLEAQKNNNT